MSLQVNFYALFSSLQKKVGEGEFSPSAFEYLRDVTLAGKYRGKDDFENPTREDFYALISFFNRMSPDSSFLKAKGLSYKFQRIQRLLELDGFEDWWAENGVGWKATLDLSDGVESEAFMIFSLYQKKKGLLKLGSGSVLTKSMGDMSLEDLTLFDRARKEIRNAKRIALKVSSRWLE